MSDDTKQGVYEKYTVKRTDGRSEPGEKHAGCRHFVLDLDHDPHAVAALRAYAESCVENYPALAQELQYTVQQLESHYSGVNEDPLIDTPDLGFKESHVWGGPDGIFRSDKPNRNRPSDPEDRPSDPEDIEALAAVEHESWCGWLRYQLPRIRRELEAELNAAELTPIESKPDGGLDHTGFVMVRFDQLPCIQRWARQMATPYAGLSEKEKESDRKEVREKVKVYRRSKVRRSEVTGFEGRTCGKAGCGKPSVEMVMGSLTYYPCADHLAEIKALVASE